jgi:hypothetical protein
VDYNGVVSFTCGGAPLGASCKAPSTVTLNIGSPATYSITVPTSGKSVAIPNHGRQKSPQNPAVPMAVAESVALAAAFCFLMILFIAYGDARANDGISTPVYNRLACVLATLLFLIPIISALQGCGGGASSAPLPQGNQLVTPSGTSILVLTPSANSNSGKALQLAPIQLTLVVN